MASNTATICLLYNDTNLNYDPSNEIIYNGQFKYMFL